MKVRVHIWRGDPTMNAPKGFWYRLEFLKTDQVSIYYL